MPEYMNDYIAEMFEDPELCEFHRREYLRKNPDLHFNKYGCPVYGDKPYFPEDYEYIPPRGGYPVVIYLPDAKYTGTVTRSYYWGQTQYEVTDHYINGVWHEQQYDGPFYCISESDYC
jgi:hypothetical protein